MNLPSINSNNFQLSRRSNKPRHSFRMSWGARSENIKPGDFIDGIILGFEREGEFNTKTIILRSLSHNLQEVKVWSCTAIEREMHEDDECTIPLYQIGDCIRITFKGSYIGTKGKGLGKLIASFDVDSIINYDLSSEDITAIESYNYRRQHLESQKPIHVYSQQQLWACETLLPVCGRLPVTWHTLAMM